MTAPRAEYEHRLAEWRTRIAHLDRTALHLSNGRLLAVASTAALVWAAWFREVLPVASPLAGVFAFGVLAVLHGKVLARVARARRAEQWFVDGLRRLDGRWREFGRDGELFAKGHLYARDLDLFGHSSLFHLLNTTRTEAGEWMLASWLAHGAGLDDVKARHGAVEELSTRLDVRERLAVIVETGSVGRTSTLVAWAAAAPAGFGPYASWVFGAAALILIFLSMLALAQLISWSLVLAWLIVEFLVARVWRARVLLVADRIGKPAEDLAALAECAGFVEGCRFDNPRLVAVQRYLGAGATGAAAAIRRLTGYVSLLESSNHNLFFRPITQALLVPGQLAAAIDRWHVSHAKDVGDWLAAIGEIEALSALATYRYEHPEDPFPSFDPAGPIFEAEGLAHPLLPETAAIRNDVALGAGHPRVIVISGSNMSGKSTLLRAVGVNVVLAHAGAPVRATRLHLSHLALGATLRVEDSLEEGTSRFYAEITRIRAIVEQARGRVPVLFLLDEILHGTNSFDRRVGAEAIVRALVAAGAVGLVTTHDLALTEVAADPSSTAVNMHFEDRLENGRMVFDYRIRPGIVTHSNALALMRSVGLDV